MNVLKRCSSRWQSPPRSAPAPRRRRSPTTSSRSACCPTCRACTPISPAPLRRRREDGSRGFGHREARLQGRSHFGGSSEQAGCRLQHCSPVVRRRQGGCDRRRANWRHARGQPDHEDKGKASSFPALHHPISPAKRVPNTIHWTYDTWMLANGTGGATVKSGGDTWFFLTADYAFGHALERDTGSRGAEERRQGAGQGARADQHSGLQPFLLQAQA